MEHSIFYTRKSSKDLTLPVSFLLLEKIQQMVTESPTAVMGEVLDTASEFCFNKKPSAQLQEEWIEVLQEFRQEVSSAADTAPPKKSMGTEMMEWLGKLQAADMCMLLAGFDPEKAERLYCWTDYRVVMAMVKVYTQGQWQQLLGLYEANMYGFGGGYKGDTASSGDVKTFDLTKGDSKGLEQLKQLGF